MSQHPVQVVAITGGKGGVGKTNISVNLCLALGDLGRRVALFDADLGLANVDVLLGLNAAKNLSDVLNGECELDDILLEGPKGIRVIPASSGTKSMASLGQREHAGLIHAFSLLAKDIDILVIDTAAGITDTVVSFVHAAQETLLVVCNEPSSITDAYAMIKLLSRDYGMERFRVVASMTNHAKEGIELYNKLQQVANRFLDVTLLYEGHIPFDENIKRAVQKQKAVYEYAPRSKAAFAFKALAKKVDAWPIPTSPRGHLEFFVEQLITKRTG